jgi:hypothetical protein
MATEDGQAQLFTDTWGPSNRSPRLINAVDAGAETSTHLISIELAGTVGAQDEELEQRASQFPLAEEEVLAAIAAVEGTGDTIANVKEACHQADLEVPEHHWHRNAAEGSGFSLLGLGDLYFISITFEVFGLSQNHFVSFLPLSELQLVAFSVMVALLLLTRLTGHLIRKLAYLIELRESENTGKDIDQRRLRRLTIRSWFVGAIAGAGILAALGTLFGISQVRASYLQQKHIAAHSAQFLLVQLGVATAGFVLSYFMAHPLDREWRSALIHENAAVVRLKELYDELAMLVGGFNSLVRQRDADILQHRSWALATNSDASRKGELAARRHQLSLPEPTTERLLPDELPKPAAPLVVEEIDTYLAGKPSIIKVYAPLSLEKVEKRLEELEDQRRKRDVGRHEHLIKVIERERTRVFAPSGGNGKKAGAP